MNKILRKKEKASHFANELKNKVVVITGGGQGIGRNIATEFAKNQAKVIICARTKKDVYSVKKEIAAFGGKCESFSVDVSDNKKIDKFINDVLKKYHKIDVLINCAGIYGPIGPLEKNDMAFWNKTLDINVFGTANCIHAVIPSMKKRRKGKIINFCGGGIGSNKIKPNFSAYTTSKSAVVGLTEVMANELRSSGIQINAISPGAVNTRLLDQVLASKNLVGKEFFRESIEQKKKGGTPPEKAAKLCLFLATSKADFVTGKLLSAVWDNYDNFKEIRKEIIDTSLYTMRRIDNFQFKQIK
ncbi:MAG TPA: SDR family oxidoreductase [Candidatus Paceibacterota bacterium]|nr:SDR family oxidoreductase [Candidatus Paceibacterota bacterium]